MYTTVSGVHRRIPLSSYDPILDNNTWEQINAASQSGLRPWAIGSIKTEDATTGVTPKIWTLVGYGHDDLADGSGKAGMTFITADTTNNYQRMNTSSTNVGGYNSSYLRVTVIPNTLFPAIPEELQTIIKPVTKLCTIGNLSVDTSAYIFEDLWVPSLIELGISGVANDGESYEYYIGNESRIKYARGTTSGTARPYWTRTSAIYAGQFHTITVSGSGGAGTRPAANVTTQFVALGMCI